MRSNSDNGMLGLERVQRDAVCAHQGFHVGPGRVGALGQRIRPLVDLVIQDLEAHVGDADVVDVGKDQRRSNCGLLPRLVDRVELAAHVSARLLHVQKHRVKSLLNLIWMEHEMIITEADKIYQISGPAYSADMPLPYPSHAQGIGIMICVRVAAC